MNNPESITVQDPPEFSMGGGPVVDLRWNKGVLEMGAVETIFRAGRADRQEIRWKEVPIFKAEENKGI